MVLLGGGNIVISVRPRLKSLAVYESSEVCVQQDEYQVLKDFVIQGCNVLIWRDARVYCSRDICAGN